MEEINSVASTLDMDQNWINVGSTDQILAQY